MYKPFLEHRNPHLTFDNFSPQNEAQQNACLGLRGLASKILERERGGGDLDLPVAKVLNLFGHPGVGKSHLLQAFGNSLLSKNDLPIGYLVYSHPSHLHDSSIKNFPVLLIDDLFHKYQNLSEIKGFELDDYMEFIKVIYEGRKLVVTTCNFSQEQLLERIQARDQIGRVISRAQQIMPQSIEIIGEDYRKKLGQAQKDPFDL